MTILHEAGLAVRAVPFARDLAAHGDRVALLTAEGEMSYGELAARVEETAARLGPHRRLVQLTAGADGGNTADTVIAYLAALAGGHPLLLTAGTDQTGTGSALAGYDPDVVIGAGGIEERRAFTAHDLHPDLALLLSTSGSTGSAKLVRLSHDNLQSNAEAIAGYLRLTPDDRAATTLPMHYCYGLSVINSHLLRGAGLILTGLSVSDPRFWELFRERGGTGFAGVPYTFELLDRIGFERMRLPRLRYVTQAGGRLAPRRVRHYAELGRRDGWELYVMYGQTEATARMAYLPPRLAASRPECVGVPIPGGAFRLDPLPDWPDDGCGELVYSGPNVMLGYADGPADLALGRTVGELRTGDVARRTPDGLYQIVGRRSRFIKCYGLRVDLNQVEAVLREAGLDAYCAGSDERLTVAVLGGGDPGAIRQLAARAAGLPPRAVDVCPLTTLPRLASGKPDYRAIAALPRERVTTGVTDVRELFAEVLDCPEVTDDDTFTGLGGDSLSYVETSIRLERMLGHLPDRWHDRPIRELRQAGPGRRRARTLDTSVALRALAIVLVVGTHAGLFAVAGGAHLLLGVAGFNFGRFHLTGAAQGERLRGIGRTVRRIALASMAWIAVAFLITDSYRVAHVFLLHYVAGRGGHNDYWFIETLVYVLLAMLAVIAIPVVDRVERRYPFGLPLALMLVGLITRYGLVPGSPLPTPLRAFWLFALGWAAAKATSRTQRLCVTVAALATVPGFFGDLPREGLIMAGLTLLIWVGAVPSTLTLNRVAGVLAGASLYIYLTHWQVFPLLAKHSPFLAVVACLAAGLVYGAVAKRVPGAVRSVPRWGRAASRS